MGGQRTEAIGQVGRWAGGRWAAGENYSVISYDVLCVSSQKKMEKKGKYRTKIEPDMADIGGLEGSGGGGGWHWGNYN